MSQLDIEVANKKPEVDEIQLLKDSKKSLDLFKTIIPSIFQSKRDELQDESLHNKYPAFMVTRAMSQHMDCIGLAQNLNMRPHIPNRAHYVYLLNTVRKGARPYVPWAKKPETEEAIDIVSTYSGISRKKAEQSVKCLTKAQIEKMRETLDAGGI